MAALSRPRARRGITLLAVAVAALALRVVTGVGFVNYDSLYALVWGQQLARGQTPEYGISIAPTPHPLVELLGVPLAALGPAAAQDVLTGLGFLALAGCGWAVFALGRAWFGTAAGVLAAVVLVSRVPVLSYGARAYVDIPYLFLVLSALVVEVRRPRAGAPVLVLLALAGLLRPEAWAFSGLYWLYLAATGGRGRPELVRLAALGLAAPALWVLSDALVTGNPLWSLTNTRDTAQTLKRVTGLGNVPQYIPRRIGEILRPAGLVGAAAGGVLSLAWLRDRARPGALAGGVAVLVLAVFATAGLPINTRYAFGAAAVLCVFCGAGAFGWTQLPAGDRRRRPWMAVGALVLLVLVAYIPSQWRLADRELDSLAQQQTAGRDLARLVSDGTINLRCGPVGVPNHRPVPLLSLDLRAGPSRVISAQAGTPPARGQYVDAATAEVRSAYILDIHDPHPPRSVVPAGFALVGGNASWRVYARCR